MVTTAVSTIAVAVVPMSAIDVTTIAETTIAETTIAETMTVVISNMLNVSAMAYWVRKYPSIDIDGLLTLATPLRSSDPSSTEY